MTNLREKIAVAVARELVRQAQNCGEYQARDCYEVADAVIRELDMFKEDGECSYCHAQLPGCRYICDWRTDD